MTSAASTDASASKSDFSARLNLMETLRASGLPREQQITAYAIDSLFRGLSSVMGNLLVFPVAMVALMWGHVNQGLLLGWLGANLLLGAGRHWLLRAYARQMPTSPLDLRRWAYYFTLTSLVSGTLWGIGGIIFFVPDSVVHQVILYVTIMGVVAGTLILVAYWVPIFYAYSLPSVGLSAWQLFNQPDMGQVGLGILMLLGLAIMANTARQQNRDMLEGIALRFENHDLIARLRDQTVVAEEANAAKSRFLAAASHDLRQPLHALQLFVGSLSPGMPAGDQQAVIAGIERTVGSLDGLFNALLDISRLDAGLLRPDVRDFRLADLVESFDAEFRLQAAAQGLGWHVDVGNIVVRSEPVLLETILRNLISNALRYTHSGRVELMAQLIEGAPANERIRISVCDTGIGIPPALHQAIFTEYYQVGNPERDRTKGLGLGLAIVDRLVRLLGHELTVDSEAGNGSRFKLDVPVGRMVAGLPAAGQMLPEVGELRDMHVIVIDDEQLVREGMDKLLQTWGCTTVLAGDAEEALALIADTGRVPDVIVADYRLREHRTGAEVIALVRARCGQAIPALLITGDTAPERLREAQATDLPLMHKPVSPVRLRGYLRQVRAQSSAG